MTFHINITFNKLLVYLLNMCDEVLVVLRGSADTFDVLSGDITDCIPELFPSLRQEKYKTKTMHYACPTHLSLSSIFRKQYNETGLLKGKHTLFQGLIAGTRFTYFKV